MKFTHLHTHSHYSLLDGLAKIDDLIAKAKEYNMDALALTDHGVMYGIVEFYQKCKKAGIKPILGVEVYVAANGRHNKRAKVDEEKYHLVLLAKNDIGYKNLIKLTSLAHLEGFYYKPRVDWESLEKYHDGLIAMSACLGGEIPTLVKNGNLDKAKNRIQKYCELFGAGNFYLELQSHKDVLMQKEVNSFLIKLSKELSVPIVASNDIHYVDYEDREAHDILLCLQTKKKITDTNRMSMMEFDVSFRSQEQMIEDFADIPEAIANTEKIVEQCNVEIELGITQLPHYELPDGVTVESYLNKLCVQGLFSRYKISEEEIKLVKNEEAHNTERNKFVSKVLDRMYYELEIIKKMGFPSYFLIVQDFVNWAKNNGVVVGPGRGSAAGALVSYLLNITDIDPLEYDLLFERFLNPERISMPDIDIDFADSKREDVIRYVEDKYGKDHVAQIITFGTMAARAAVRDVGRVLDLPYEFCDKAAKMIPMFCTLDKALGEVPEVKEFYNNDSNAKKLIDTAMKLEGVARHSSRHACGVLITRNDLTSYVPLQYASSDDKTIVAQYSLHPIEDLGLLKMDFLGLKNLTIIERAIKIIKRIYNRDIKIESIPVDDKKTYKLFQDGNTTGVFQFESSGMRRYLKELKPTDIEDLIAMGSLYRPGPMDLIPDYILVKHGKKKTSYLHHLLKPILDKTHGIAIYQEQLLEIAKDLAGFTLGEADVLRRAIGKKNLKLLSEQKNKFIEGCVKNGIKKDIAKKVFAFMEPFARYGFNRSHAACYAIISYQTAYLKANYPAEFMAALMTSDYGNLDKIAVEIQECSRMGIEILPPDINESFKTFTVVSDNKGRRNKIRFGLSAVKNLGANIIESIKEEREMNGKFKDLDDFVKRIDSKDFNKKSLESLIKSGTLDVFSHRGKMLAHVDKILNYARDAQKFRSGGQDSLFGENQIFRLTLGEGIDISKKDKLLWEKEFLGLYISGHPFKAAGKFFADKIVDISKLNYAQTDTIIRVGGVVGEIKKIITKKQEMMSFVKIEDATGTAEIIVFPSVLKEYNDLFLKDRAVVIMGNVSDKDGIKKIICNEVLGITAENIKQVKNSLSDINFNIQVEQEEAKDIFDGSNSDEIEKRIDDVYITINQKEYIDKLKKIFLDYQGVNPVYFKVQETLIKTSYRIAYNKDVRKLIAGIVGEVNIK